MNQYRKHKVEKQRAQDNVKHFAPHWAKDLSPEQIEELNRKDKPNALDGMAKDSSR